MDLSSPASDQVQAVIEVVEQRGALRLAARVAATEPQPLTWRLVVESTCSGGRSRSAQSGTADGSESRPVSLVVLRADCRGRASLTVEHGSNSRVTVVRDFGARPKET